MRTVSLRGLAGASVVPAAVDAGRDAGIGQEAHTSRFRAVGAAVSS
jgi:hypothetical protein